MTCMEAEKMVIPYINDQLSVTELEDFIDPDRTIILTLELGEGAAGAAAMEATMVNPARAEIVARPRCVVVFIIVPPTLP